jgi:hypothetical protein
MTGDRTSPDLITEMLDMLDRHGYVRGDKEHTGRAILLISDLAHIYEGSQDHPFGPYINEIPPIRTEPAPPEPVGQDAVLVSPGEVKTLLAALDIAADYQRDRAELCADCTGRAGCRTSGSRTSPTRRDRTCARPLLQPQSRSLNAAFQPSLHSISAMPQGPRHPGLPDATARHNQPNHPRRMNRDGLGPHEHQGQVQPRGRFAS